MRIESTQIQARALGDPTRHRIFSYLADADHAVGVDELTSHLGLNHNAIRQHLSKLVDAGLALRATAEASGRGRPRLVFRVEPSTHERWGFGGSYRQLSLLLVEMLRTGDSAIDVGRRAGREMDLGNGSPVDELALAMARTGFDPTRIAGEESTELVFGHCPFADAATADPATICALHLGLAEGLAEELEGVVVEDLQPHDPIRAGCRLSFRVEGNTPTPEAG